MAAIFSGLSQAQYLDASYFNTLWQEMFDQGQISLAVPPDEEIWQLDLGRSLQVAFEWLGDLRGKRVLELGCGPGDYTIMMARRGAQVTAVDIAPASLSITHQRAEANRVHRAVQVNWMAAETLAFPAETFDWVVGFGLLHHRVEMISVIVPVHKGSQTLPTCLQALQYQSHAPDEIIIVDDGST